METTTLEIYQLLLVQEFCSFALVKTTALGLIEHKAANGVAGEKDERIANRTLGIAPVKLKSETAHRGRLSKKRDYQRSETF